MPKWKRLLLVGAGFGAGFALLGAVLFGLVAWWSSRPAKTRPWNTTALQASDTEVRFSSGTDEAFIILACRVKNNSGDDYSIPQKPDGRLMVVTEDNGVLEERPEAFWSNDVTIPAGTTVNVPFTFPFKLVNYDLTAAQSSNMTIMGKWVDERLSHIRGLKFYDSAHKYELDCPDKWTGVKH